VPSSSPRAVPDIVEEWKVAEASRGRRGGPSTFATANAIDDAAFKALLREAVAFNVAKRLR
jgi:hypothetical protein